MHFANTPMGHYSSSPGSIYPALKMLTKANYVAYGPVSTGRPVYELTMRGLAELRRWLRQDFSEGDFERSQEAFLLRLAFLDAEKDYLLSSTLLAAFLRAAAQRVDQLTAFKDSAVFRGLPLHASLSVNYGLQTAHAAHRWAKQAIKAVSQALEAGH
jgi:DNA-binding PadR family transcriptional regulator